MAGDVAASADNERRGHDEERSCSAVEAVGVGCKIGGPPERISHVHRN